MISIDTLISMILILIIVTSTLILTDNRLFNAKQSKEVVEARLITDTVANTIECIYKGNDGYSTDILLPPNIEGYSYRLKVNRSGVLLELGGWRCYSPFFAKKITDTTLREKDVYMYPGHSYSITNYRDQTGYYWVIIKQV
jgi:hypothetical protein